MSERSAGALVADSLNELAAEIVSCRRCSRLVEFREEVARVKRRAYKDCHYWGKPLPGFGDGLARLLVVGLAPAAHGGNRTGRVFTGDSSATFLMQGLHRHGFANKPDSVHADDGLTLTDAYIVAAVRCVPPDNKPTPEEVLNCRPFLLAELALLPRLTAVLALGKIAFDGYRKALAAEGLRLPRAEFGHGVECDLAPALPRLFASYHPSRQNTQTGRLTPAMFDDVLGRIRAYLD